jgi:hypothetical protein
MANESIKGKTLADFDKLNDDNAKCDLLNQYIAQSEAWLESIGKRTEFGRWAQNIRNLRPYHRDMIEKSAVPKCRVYLAYSNLKTIAPEIIKKWPVIQVVPNKIADKQWSDQAQARLDQFLADSDFLLQAQKTALRAISIETSIMGMRFELNKETGILSAKCVNRDIFSWLPSAGFTGTGMGLSEGESLFVSYKTPVNSEIVEQRYGVKSAIDSDAVKYSTAGILKLLDTTAAASSIFTEFYWMCKKQEDITDEMGKPTGKKKDVRYIRGVHFVRLKEGGRNFQYKIVNDSEIDRDTENGPAMLPEFRYTNDLDETTGFGTADSELVANNQKEINLTLSNACTVLKRNAIPPIFLSKAKDKTEAQSIVEKFMQGIPLVREKVTDIMFGESPSFNPGTMPFVEQLINVSNISTSINKVMMGDPRYAKMSGVAIAALMEASNAVVGLKLETDATYFCTRVGKCVLKNLKEKDVMIKQTMQLSFKDQMVPYGPEVMKQSGGFNVSVVAAGGLPKGRFATEARAMDLYEKKIFTPLEMIDNLAENDTDRIKKDWLDWNKVTGQMQHMKEQMEVEPQFIIKLKEIMTISESEQFKVRDSAWVSKYKLAEDAAAMMLKKFPDLSNAKEFGYLPTKIQTDLLKSAFLVVPKPEDMQAPQVNAQTQGAAAV